MVHVYKSVITRERRGERRRGGVEGRNNGGWEGQWIRIA